MACKQMQKMACRQLQKMRKGFYLLPPYEIAIMRKGFYLLPLLKWHIRPPCSWGSASWRQVCCIYNLSSLQERKQPETAAQQLWPRIANPESGSKTTRTGPQTRTSMQSTPQVACAEKWSMPLTLSLSAQSIVIAPTASVYMVSIATLIAGLRLGDNWMLAFYFLALWDKRSYCLYRSPFPVGCTVSQRGTALRQGRRQPHVLLSTREEGGTPSAMQGQLLQMSLSHGRRRPKDVDGIPYTFQN